MRRCCICGKKFNGYGNNPEPVAVKGRCCDDCNEMYVIPARLQSLEKIEGYMKNRVRR